MTPLYPGIKVSLIGGDGNALMILGKVVAAIRKSDITEPELVVSKFLKEATANNYDNLLRVCMKYVEVS